ncbi:MAG: class I SAM-dependent methyltransferase [Streptosporangiaceae bacterium]
MTDQMTGHSHNGHSQQVRQLFDVKASGWQAKYAPDGRLTGRLNKLADAVGYHVPAGGRVLDLGCGTGDLGRHLASSGLRVTGCDISANMLSRAAAGDPRGVIDLLRLDPSWRVLPFLAGHFDAVVASSVLEYTDSPGAVLVECARVLRPGGVMLCTVPDLTHPVRWLEGFARLAARAPWVRNAGQQWPRLDRYLTYLSISRQRRTAGWWKSAAARAGLITIPRSIDETEHSPLRLFTFQRPTGARKDWV